MRSHWHSSPHAHSQAVRRRFTPLLAAGVAAALTLSGCGSSSLPVQDPTNVLQAVNVHLGTDSHVASVTSSDLYANEATGKSGTKDRDYTTRDVVNDLPVRITTQYQTDDSSGTDLKDLDGYTGNLTINLTVENLTVAPQKVSYDAGGQQRTTTALVGVPMTVAGSTVLDGTSPNQVTGDATHPEAANGSTNGVVSTNDDGKTVVQWSSLLAPPASGASSTMRLNLKAKDFHAPKFDVAVQPGFSNNLTSEGVLDSAFSDKDSSQTALLRRTIELASQIDETLASAGGQVSEIRQDLDENANTLGKTAAEDLSTHSKKTAETMKDLSEKVDALDKDLTEASTQNRTQLTDQLQTTVKSLDSMLGDTSAAAPALQIGNGHCDAPSQKPQASGTVYSNLVQLSGFLKGYAATTQDCQQQLSGSMRSLIGPEKPSAQACTEQSLTCSLYGSSTTVVSSLMGLAANGEKALDSLQPTGLQGAQANMASLDTRISDLEKTVDGLDAAREGADLTQQLEALKTSVSSASESAEAMAGTVGDLKASLQTLHETAVKAKAELSDADGSMEDQNQALSDELCRLDGGDQPAEGKLSSDQVEKLRSYLTSSACDEAPAPQPQKLAKKSPASRQPAPAQKSPSPTQSSESAPSPSSSANGSAPASPSKAPEAARAAAVSPHHDLIIQTAADTQPVPPSEFSAPMDKRLEDQATAWDSVIAETDLDSTDTSSMGARIRSLDTGLTTLTETLGQIEDQRKGLADASGSHQMEESIQALQDAVTDLRGDAQGVSTSLKAVGEEQDELTQNMKKAFKDTSAKTAAEVSTMLDEQARTLSAKGRQSSDAVVAAFGRSVEGLTVISDDVVAAAHNSVKEQHRDLAQQDASLQNDIDSQTKDSLTQLDQRTAAATRDLAGSASMLTTDMNKVLLDLGDRSGSGSGLLGALDSNAAKADSADYQLALAQQNAQGYANVRSQDIDGLQLKQAQFKASLKKLAELHGFHTEENSGASVKAIYTFHLEASQQ